MTDRTERYSETRHRMGFMLPLLIFVLAFVACCGVIACVFLRAAGISDEAAQESAGISLCRSAAEAFRAGEIPESGEKVFFTKDMTPCGEPDAYYYIETVVDGEETETGTLFTGNITAYTAEQDKAVYAIEVKCYRPEEETHE